MNRTHTTARGFALGLESLSDRIVPSCTVTEAAGVVRIMGDAAANFVDITDDGTTVTVAIAGAETKYNDVTKIVVSLASGNDRLTYRLEGELAADSTRKLEVWLGNGHDAFFGTLADGEADPDTGEVVGSALGDGATFGVCVRGHNGHDRLYFDAPATDVGAGASLSVVLGGGNGKDTLDAVYGGQLLGDLVFWLNGSNGNDTISADATFEAIPEDTTPDDPTDDVAATGTAKLCLLGGNGKDTFSLFATDDSDEDGTSSLTDLTARVHGGHGKNIAFVSDDVDVYGAKSY